VNRSAASIAWLATWRVVVMLGSLLFISGVPAAAVFSRLLGVSAALPLLLFVVLFPASVFVHEWAHALCAFRWSAIRGRREVAPVSGWGVAMIVRPVLPIRFDLATTLAGPLAGVLTAAPLVPAAILAAAPAVECLALAVPFAAHLLALAPIAPDGRAVIATFRSLEPSSGGSS